jgi:SAM-dependent methyltransferase
MGALEHARPWEEWGTLDPLWANLTQPGTQHGAWDLEDFWRLGREEIASVMAVAVRFGRPQERREALDFGCGAGRLTRALCAHFERTIGVDVAQSMLTLAQALNRGLPCRFLWSGDGSLARLPDRSVDLVYSSLVLQHLPGVSAIRGAIADLARLVRPSGLLSFQLPTAVPRASLKERIAIRTRVYAALRRVGVPGPFLYAHLRLRPAMRMTAMPSEEVARHLEALGFVLLETTFETFATGDVRSATYFASPVATA